MVLTIETYLRRHTNYLLPYNSAGLFIKSSITLCQNDIKISGQLNVKKNKQIYTFLTDLEHIT